MLIKIEKTKKLKYILCGNYLNKENKITDITYLSALEIPNIGRATGSQPVQCDSFLVVTQENEVIADDFLDNKDRIRFSIDQRQNPGSIVMRLGGLWNEETIISGSITTIHKTKEAQQIMKLFYNEIKKFHKVKAYFAGPKAYSLFQNGNRLACAAIESPAEFDLKE